MKSLFTKSKNHDMKSNFEERSGSKLDFGKHARSTSGNTTAISISVVALVFIFAFLYFFTGVFGETRLGITLRTNPDLENGLVGHWTFDETGVSTLIPDSSGNSNDGTFYVNSATTSEQAIDTTANTSDVRHQSTGPTLVWTSEDEGFILYLDSDGDMMMASTTDGGGTWGLARDISTGGNDIWQKLTVWYDGWNETNFGNSYIHISSMETVNDDSLYFWYDPATNATSTDTASPANFGVVSDASFSTFTRTDDGTLWNTGNINSGSGGEYCTTTCETTANWTSSNPVYGSAANEPTILMPIPGSDEAMILFWDASSNQIEYSTTTGTSWSSFVQIASEVMNTTYRGSTMGATVDYTTGRIYFAYIGDANDYVTSDHDIELLIYEGGAEGTWSLGTDPVTDASGGLVSVKLATDRVTGDIYVVYGRRTTIGTNTTTNIYWKVSRDGGQSWSAEQGPVNDTADNITGITTNLISPYRIGVAWKYDTAPNADDYYYATIAELVGERDRQGARTSGKLGQGVEFDGVDDYINAGSGASLDDLSAMSACGWFYFESASTDARLFSKDSGASGAWYIDIASGSNKRLRFIEDWSGGDVGVESANNAFRLNEWTHICLIWNGGDNSGGTDARFYVNGVDSFNSSTAGGSDIYSDASEELRLSASSNDFEGIMDDVRIYNRALSVSEVSRLYDLGATTKIAKTLSTNPDLKNGLIGHWTFDGADMDLSSNTAEALDRSGNANDGNWYDHATTTVSGKIGQAIEFDANDDYINVGSDPELDDVTTKTLAGWFKLDSPPSGTFGARIMEKETGCGGGWYLYLDNADLLTYAECFTSDDVGQWDSDRTFPINEWYHFVVTYDNTSDTNDPIMYINGESISITESDAPVGSAVTENTADLVIGAEDGGVDSFPGILDDIRMYNRILSADEAKRLYNLGATTKVSKTIKSNPDLESGLLGHWTFDGPDLDWSDTSFEILDVSGNGYPMDAIVNSDYGSVASGKIGQAFDFDTGADSLETNTSDLQFINSTISSSVWIKPRTQGEGNFGVIIAAGGGTDGTWYLSMCTNDGSECPSASRTIAFYQTASNSAWWHSPDQSIPLNEWSHVVVTYDRTSYAGSAPIIYINGESVTVTEQDAPGGTVSEVNTEFIVGVSGGSDDFDGLIDDVRVYDRILSAEEIKRIYQLGGGN